jgi:hypothetical protein
MSIDRVSVQFPGPQGPAGPPGASGLAPGFVMSGPSLEDNGDVSVTVISTHWGIDQNGPYFAPNPSDVPSSEAAIFNPADMSVALIGG